MRVLRRRHHRVHRHKVQKRGTGGAWIHQVIDLRRVLFLFFGVRGCERGAVPAQVRVVRGVTCAGAGRRVMICRRLPKVWTCISSSTSRPAPRTVSLASL